MISLITRYILFIQFIFNSFTTISISVKTYQVDRINETTYVVTSLPEIDTDSRDNRKRFLDQKNTTGSLDDLIPLMYDKFTTGDFGTTISTVTVGEKKEKVVPKITPELIKKARENYFRTYFAMLAKLNATSSPQGDNAFQNLTLLETSTDNNRLTAKLNQNLQIARKFASVLINEGQIQVEFKAKDKFSLYESEFKRRKRQKGKKDAAKQKLYWAGKT